MNGMGQEIVKGGPITRKDPATGNLSCLDLCIVSRELLPFVQKLVIDSGREMAVARAVKMGKKYKLVYSDHFTCLLTFANLPRRQEAKEARKMVLNLAKEGGWDQYKMLTNKYSEALKKSIGTEETVEEKMTKFDKTHNKIKFKAFGKVTVGRKPINTREVEQDVPAADRAKALFEEQEERANNAIEKIKKMKLPKVGKIWEIRKEIFGGKKAALETTAIIHPISGDLVVSKPKIKEVSLEYCKNTLRNNVAQEGYREHIQSKIEKVKKKLKEDDGSISISKETFNTVLAKFKRPGKKIMTFWSRQGKNFMMLYCSYVKK